MTNFNNYQQQFTGPQSILQSGFAGTDPQQVRQQIAQSGGYGQQGQQQFGQQQAFNGANNFNQFSGPQSISQPGFAGTDAQQVRQQNAQSAQFGGQQFGQQQPFAGANNFNQFSGPQSITQPGFAGTDPQQVRQQIAQSGGYGQPIQQQFGQQSFGGQQSFSGPQSIMQPGFAGTDAQQVRQQNAQSTQFGGNGQSFIGQQSQGYQNAGVNIPNQFAGPQSILQPGFAGTDPQQVRQQISQTQNQSYQNGFFQ